jgi:DmsE family decaheme c-type cytochrome
MLSLILATALAAAHPPALATPAGAEACVECHQAAVVGFAGNVHARLRPFEVGTASTGCSSCHGDAAKHLESGDATTMKHFGDDDKADSTICLDCHGNRHASEWGASVHATEVGCTSCHSVHTAVRAESTCDSCHADVRALMVAPSHHPVKEGKMACASCHDVHAANPGALKTTERTNDLCTTCHTAQEGPFIFEHAPVVEDCLTCHNPHGSVANNLLLANEPFLCLQCHEFHFHTGLGTEDATNITIGGKPYPNVMGEYGYQRGFATKCTQCHTAVHGSDLPSQTVSGIGKGLVR